MTAAARFRVLWVYQTVKVHGKRIEAGQKPSLCFRGRKHMFCVAAGHPVRVLKRDATDFDRLRLVQKSGEEYPIDDAVKQFRKIAGRHGITVSAEAVLQRAENNTLQINESLEESLTNEEEEFTTMSESPNATTTASSTTNGKEATTMSKKATKKPGMKAVKARSKSKSNGKTRAPKAKGPTPFRAGTMKEKAFLAFKAAKKEYDGLEHGGKKEWCEALAKKLGASGNTVKSWVGGQFTKELSR